jgi:predicted  nucleic acid-binding Zn-ribbon protein
MERMMEPNRKHEGFAMGNEELRQFLRKVDGLANGTASVSERDLRLLSERLSNLGPEIGDASRGEMLDASLQNEIAEYVRNLRALQSALERVRCIMLARKAQIEGAKRHLTGVQDWVNAYQQTT